VRQRTRSVSGMTVLVAWIAKDSRGPSSAYLSTDSRFVWPGPKPMSVWDGGRKVFASQRFPDLFGYVGDVLLPSLILARFVEALDLGLRCPDDATLIDRRQMLLAELREALKTYPDGQLRPFEIVHVGRAGERMASRFQIAVLSHENGSLKESPIDSGLRSDAVRFGTMPLSLAHGSGASEFKKHLDAWNSSSEGETSRAIFSALCDALWSDRETTIGGAP
jgi:hypothetical protein